MAEYYTVKDGVLYHHGIKGQKWGNRRWQNEDGSLTSAGREHYGYGDKQRLKAEYYDRKAERAKTKFGKRRMIYKAELNRGVANRRDILADAKRNKTKAKNVDLDIEDVKAQKAYAERMAETYKEGSRRNVAYKNQAKGKEHVQQLFEKQKSQNMSEGKRIVDSLKHDLSFKNDLTTWSGRKTNIWKEAGLAIITNGFGNIVLDEIHYQKNKKSGG